MALSGKPKKSKYQVGETVYFLNSVRGESGVVVKVQSFVSDPQSDSLGTQDNIYYLNGINKAFKEKDLFHSLNALMFNIKGDYLMKFGSIDQITFSSGDILSNCDFSYAILSSVEAPTLIYGVYMQNCKFDGSDLSYAQFDGSDLFGCSFRFAKLTNANFAGSDISQGDFRAADLSGCTMPLNANTKSSFKTTVGAGKWDAETTIWTDGNPIG